MMEWKMTDLREEIPQRAYINAEIIQVALNTLTFRESIDAVKRKYQLQEYDFVNPAYIISLLYCLLVVPREVWLKNEPDQTIYEEVKKCASLRYFVITNPENHDGLLVGYSVHSFLKHLRNSVAHARFSIDREMVFTFSDQENKKDEQQFRVSISARNLMEFLSEVGAILANIRSRGR
jgi:hypothetical protein